MKLMVHVSTSSSDVLFAAQGTFGYIFAGSQHQFLAQLFQKAWPVTTDIPAEAEILR